MPHPIVRNRRQPSSIAAGFPIGFPDTIAGLTNLWRADTLTTLNDTDPVSTWTDIKSGVVASGSGTARPTFRTGIFGTQPVLRFDATNDFLTLSATVTLAIASGATIFWIWAYDVAGSTNRWIFGDTARMFANGSQVHFATSGSFIGSNNSGGNVTPQPKMYAIRYAGTTGAVSFRFNNGSGGSGSSATGDSSMSLFGKHSTGSFAGGDLSEVIVYNRELTTVECDSLYTNYFKIRYTTLP